LPGFADRIGRVDRRLVASVQGSAPSGFTQTPFGSSAGRIWILYDLFVAVGARGKGVGRLLMERARYHGLETAARSIVLSTAKTNDVAQRLYESLGYKRDDEFLTYELALPAV
jgi:ribosomal protein S18 acetylase RimI-like enzyme